MQSTPKKIAVTVLPARSAIPCCFGWRMVTLYGKSQPIELRRLDLPQAQDAVRGVVMELEDCAFPLLHNIVMTDDPRQAFEGVDAAFLVGSRPRSKGMERRDLLAANAEIFKVQGRAINEVAGRRGQNFGGWQPCQHQRFHPDRQCSGLYPMAGQLDDPA